MSYQDQNSLCVARHASRQFLLFVLTFGLAYAILTPPFFVNDENVHLYRVFELSEGRLLTRSDTNGQYQMVPADFRHTTARFFYFIKSWRKRGPVQFSQIGHSLRLGNVDETPTRVKARAGSYSPVPYLAQIPTVWLARVLGLPCLWHMYLARIFSLAAYAALAAFAISKASRLCWGIFVLALLPMALTQAAGVSADGLTNGLALLFFVLLARRSVLDAQDCTDRYAVALGSLVLALSLCKPVFVVLALTMPVLQWSGKRAVLKRWGYTVASIVVPTAVVLAWTYLNRGLSNSDPYSAPAQLHWLEQHPASAVTVAGATVLERLDDWLIQFAVFRDKVSSHLRFQGGLDVALAMLLATTACWGAAYPTGLQLKRRLMATFWIMAAWFAHFGAVALAMYLTYNPMGNSIVNGIQGRYFLPMAGAIAVVLSIVGKPTAARWLAKKNGRAVQVSVALLNLGVLLALTGHYYGAVSH